MSDNVIFPPPAGFSVYECPCGTWTVEHEEPARPWMLTAVEDVMTEHAAECPTLTAAIEKKNGATP